MSWAKLLGDDDLERDDGLEGARRRRCRLTPEGRDPAIWNAMSEESTLWNLPSTSVTWRSTMGFPLITPSEIV